MTTTEKKGHCLNCQYPLNYTFTDLGTTPLCEEFVKPKNLNHSQKFYPLHAYVCEDCFLVQVNEFVSPEEIYADYHYFSSYSDTWLQHAREYVDLMVEEFQITKDSFVVEIASNDGYLLQYFVEKDIPVLGIEPSKNVAAESIKKGIPTEQLFFGYKTALDIQNRYRSADLILGNNVLAHVPKIRDFISGLKKMLSDDGIMTFEFPHLIELVQNNQFDTIYHEHFFYLSLTTIQAIFSEHQLKIFDVEQLDTHGGSIRIFVCHEHNQSKEVSNNVRRLLSMEADRGITSIEYYTSFAERVKQTKRQILDLLIELKDQGKTIVGYGAPGKGNTLLNYCGIGKDFIDYTVDRNPNKHGYFLPGSLIPIYHPDKIKETKPEFIFILPWNLKNEIMNQLEYVEEWNAKFIILIPEPKIIKTGEANSQ